MTTLPLKVRPAFVATELSIEPELAPTESLFGRWSRYCFRYMPSPEEVSRAFEPHAPARDVFFVPALARLGVASSEASAQEPEILRSQERAAEILGLTQSRLHEACGIDLAVPATRRTAMCSRLRACWQCMKLGFHSVVFQHCALRRCPLHGVELSTKCPKCAAELRPSFMTIARAPFACTRCGEFWLRSMRSPYGDVDLSLVGAMLADRRLDLRPIYGRLTDEQSVEVGDPVSMSTQANEWDSARYGRHIARASAWPQARSRRWPVFQEREQTLLDWSQLPAEGWAEGGPRTRHAATHTLLQLGRLVALAGHSVDSTKLRSRLSLQPRGLRLNDRASIVSVALHRTMSVYGRCVNKNREASWPTESRSSVYDDVEWNGFQVGRRLVNSDEGNSQLIRAEILGWFVACVIDSVTLSFLRNVEWLGELPKTLYLPSWVAWQDGFTHCVRVRARASDATVRRLLRRYSTACCLNEEAWASTDGERRYFNPSRQYWQSLAPPSPPGDKSQTALELPQQEATEDS
jgi:hypothetical protein